MKAVVYEGPRQVSVKDVPDARIERVTDVLVRITTTNICGSDLHMYEGRTDFETGRWFGHENMGEVIEVGDGVDKVKVGDRVVLPFNVACGHCKNCERGLTNYCLTAQPEPKLACPTMRDAPVRVVPSRRISIATESREERGALLPGPVCGALHARGLAQALTGPYGRLWCPVGHSNASPTATPGGSNWSCHPFVPSWCIRRSRWCRNPCPGRTGP